MSAALGAVMFELSEVIRNLAFIGL